MAHHAAAMRQAEGAARPQENPRTLGPFLATLVVAGCMIGSGIFMLPASLAGIGSLSILSWLVATAGAGLIGGTLAWMAALEPEAAGLFSHIRNAFGPAAGFVSGLLYWATAVVGCVAIAIACSGYLSVYVPQAAAQPGSTVSTICFAWLLLGANWIGPRFIARIQGWTLALGLVPVLMAAAGGWFFFRGAIFAHSWNPTGGSLFTLVPRGAVMAFWAFIGIEGAIILSPRIRNPGRNVAVATLSGLAIAAIIYIAACAALMGIVPAAQLAKSSAPFAVAARVMLGGTLAGAVALCALLKASGTLGANLLVTLESLECESVTGRTRAKPRVSGVTVLCTGAVASVIVLISQSPTLVRQFTMVTNVVVVLAMLEYSVVALALVRAARVLPRAKRIAAWAVGGGAIIFCAFIIASSEADLLIWSAIPVLGALLVYFVLALRRAHRRRSLAAV